MNRWLLLCALVLAPLLALAEEVPPRTADMAQALAGEEWSQLAPGLDFIRADSKSGTRVTAFEVSANDFAIRIAVQADPDGERVDAFGERDDALLAIMAVSLAKRSRARVSIRSGCCVPASETCHRLGRRPVATSPSLQMDSTCGPAEQACRTGSSNCCNPSRC